MQQLITELHCGDYRTRRPLPKRHSQPQQDRNERRGDKERAEAKAQRTTVSKVQLYPRRF